MYYSYVLSTTPHIRYTEADFVDDDACVNQDTKHSLSLSPYCIIYVCGDSRSHLFRGHPSRYHKVVVQKYRTTEEPKQHLCACLWIRVCVVGVGVCVIVYLLSLVEQQHLIFDDKRQPQPHGQEHLFCESRSLALSRSL